MNDLPEPAAVAAFLDRFETPEAVAAECRRRGVRGTRNSCSRCLLANLIRSEFPEALCVAVSGVAGVRGHVAWGPVGDDIDFRPGVRLPAAATRAADLFDCGTFPDLVAGSEAAGGES